VRLVVTMSFTLGFLLGLLPSATNLRPMTSAKELNVEAAVCGSFREPFMFWLWHNMAGTANPRGLTNIHRVEPLKFNTRDGITLGGYKLAAKNPTTYLLVAQGNAMLADHLVSDLQSFRNRGWDVYIYDYRGYGISQGKSRLAAIVDDYVEIVTYLNTLGYAKRFLYGISMGGVILLNAVGNSDLYTGLVVDSSPARSSNLGCPERYDPVNHLPNDGARTMLISGTRDSVVPPHQMEEMIRKARSRGARILQDAEFSHPYQDAAPTIHQRRQNEVAAFLSQR
jgi:pimeloyl-ACP methyl ester carboxylesterase